MGLKLENAFPELELEAIESGGIRNSIRERQLSFLKKNPKSIVELVDRDLRVIEFILDMKFAGYAEIHQKFFAETHNGQNSASMEWARKRLRQLEQAGFLKAEFNLVGGPRVYVVTLKGYHALSRIYPNRNFPRPAFGLDTRTFIHDRELLLFRLEIENANGDVSWISDKNLKHGSGEAFGLSGGDVPDGLMKMPNVGWIAVEIEIATKARQRYRDKVQFYLKLLRDRAGDANAIRTVNFVCLRESCFKILNDECSAYGDYISVELRAPREVSSGAK